MRLVRSVTSSAAVLLVLGFFALILSVVVDCCLLGFCYCFVTLCGMVPINSRSFHSVCSTVLFLLLFMIPTSAVIWVWTMTLLREKTDLLLGVFLCGTLPALSLLVCRAPEDWVSRAELSAQATEPAKVLLFVAAWCLFGLLTLFWRRDSARAFPLLLSLQEFVERSALGQSSRPVRLLTVAILSQLLTLLAGYYIYGPIFNSR